MPLGSGSSCWLSAGTGGPPFSLSQTARPALKPPTELASKNPRRFMAHSVASDATFSTAKPCRQDAVSSFVRVPVPVPMPIHEKHEKSRTGTRTGTRTTERNRELDGIGLERERPLQYVKRARQRV